MNFLKWNYFINNNNIKYLSNRLRSRKRENSCGDFGRDKRRKIRTCISKVGVNLL